MELFNSFLALFLATFSCCLATEGGSVSPSFNILYQSTGDDVNSDKLIVLNDLAFVGGTNHFSQIDLTQSSPGNAKRIDFSATKSDQTACKQFSPNDHCENTVKVLEFTSSSTLLVCGTDAKTGKCYHYSIENSTFVAANLGAKQWLPYSPTTNTVSYVFPQPSEISEEFYFAASKGFIRKNDTNSLDTEDQWFKDPEYKSIFHSTGKNNVYLLFNEKSSNFVGENFNSDNTKEDYYSMVARVCQNDQGGSWMKNKFMTFGKVRLVCPWPGINTGKKANLFYDELVSAFPTGSSIIALFRPSRNWHLSTYAIAEFDTNDIDDVISGKTFPANKAEFYCPPSSGEKPTTETYSSTDEDQFLPGQCPKSVPYSLRSDFERFALRCTLIKKIVTPVKGKPFFIGDAKTEFEFIFAQKFSWATAVLLLTEKGFLKKLVSYSDGTVVEVFEKQILTTDEVILTAKLVESKNYILAVTSTKVYSIPVTFCGLNTDCGSCNADPHCEWNADFENFTFECVAASTIIQRTCSVPPEAPKSLVAQIADDDLEVSWQRDGLENGMMNLVTIAMQRTKEVVRRHKTTDRSLAVKRSEFQDGCEFEVTAYAVNETSLSEGSRTSFSTNLRKPDMTLTEEKGVITATWSEVTGASTYIIKLVDQAGDTVQEVSFLSTSKTRSFYFHNAERGHRYTVNLTSASEDGIESTTSDEIVPAPVATETTVVFKKIGITLNADTTPVQTQPTTMKQSMASTQGVQTELSPSTHSTLAETTRADTTQLQTTHTAKTEPVVLPQGDTAFAATGGECIGITFSLVVFVTLFAVALVVIIHNVWTIKPRINELKNDIDGCSYKRQYLLIWSKKHEQKHLKCDDAVESTTSV